MTEPSKDSEARRLAAARAIVRGHVGDVPAVWAVAVANGDVPPLASDNHRWYQPRWGRDPTTGRALNADGSANRAGRPPGAYTRHGASNGSNYSNSHKNRQYPDSGSYSKTVLGCVAETLGEQKQLQSREQSQES